MGEFRTPARLYQSGLGDRIDVVGERERYDIGLEAVDDAARLASGAAVRLFDGDALSARFLGPVFRERGVELPIELARGIVGDVQQRDVSCCRGRRATGLSDARGPRRDRD